MDESCGPREVVEKLARALDREDFVAALHLLAEDCEYRIGEGVIRGKAAVIASYRQVNEKARRTLQHVAYESAIEQVHGASVTVLFVDQLEHAGLRHTFRCRQTFTVNPSGKVQRIDHHEIDGQRQALARFFGVSGVRL